VHMQIAYKIGRVMMRKVSTSRRSKTHNYYIITEKQDIYQLVSADCDVQDASSFSTNYDLRSF